MERAAELLSTTDDPISQIALDVGFSSQSHFTTVFKKFNGVTPLAYRRDFALL
jgi:AraC family transcriptional regulator